MRRRLLAAAVLTAAVPVWACINTYGTDLQGKAVQSVFEAGDLVAYLKKPRTTDWREQKAKLGRNLDRASLEQRNDYAAALLHLGEIQPALQILLRIEKERPGRYATATNLGTAYELAGQNEHALSWIRAGIVRNPRSHGGTEWLHVAILEAKLALAKDPAWLRTHSVLGVDFGTAAVPKMPARLQLDAESTLSAIHIQLLERLQFVPPPDAVVGDLLFDYGNLQMLIGTVENAAALYDMALQYGTPRAALARQRALHARGIAARAKK
jgi:tetratricopeptide (TPR) repeat protein